MPHYVTSILGNQLAKLDLLEVRVGKASQCLKNKRQLLQCTVILLECIAYIPKYMRYDGVEFY